MISVLVQLDPGVRVPAHAHAGFVFAYVLEGKISSKLDQAEAIEYSAGQSWVEPPGTTHSQSYNPSSTEKVKFLAVFVAKNDAKLTNFKLNK